MKQIGLETFVVPAIITTKQSELDSMLTKVLGKVQRVQIDIMDGVFVPNISLNFDFQLIKGVEYEAHLMMKKPLKWIEKNADKVNIVIIHVESLKNIEAAIDYIKNMSLKVYLATKPETKNEVIIPYIKDIDGLLIMTVEPGSYCLENKFQLGPLEKIKSLRVIDKKIPIEVDGCMNPTNAKLARASGANIFASGSYIFKSNNIDKAIKQLEEAVL